MRVYGGMTGAGVKKTLQEPHGSWKCSNGHENKGYCTRCMTEKCNEKRDANA